MCGFRPAILFLLLTVYVCLTLVCPAQTVTAAQKNTASITGRVTVAGTGIQGITVVLRRLVGQGEIVEKTTTDDDGNYRLTNLAAGQFQLLTMDALFIPTEGKEAWNQGLRLTLGEGETLTGADFTLIRGGVITGRVTTRDGRALIRVGISLARLDERGQKVNVSSPHFVLRLTDDRGVYRIFGLPAGRYLVSAGGSDRNSVDSANGVTTKIPLTYHPDVTEEAAAHLVVLEAGGEVKDVDIRIGGGINTFRASGRVVDAETGQPLAGISLACGPLSPDKSRIQGYYTGFITNAQGEFVIPGVTPGSYGVLLNTESSSLRPLDYYGDPVTFDITDASVAGLLLRVRRGSSISGIVVVEGTTDKAVLALLPQLRIQVTRPVQGLDPTGEQGIRLNRDGSFRFTGLRPAAYLIVVPGYSSHGFNLWRVEHNGVAVRGPLTVGAGAEINDVRLVFRYGTSVIQGIVKLEGYDQPELPSAMHPWVYLYRPDASDRRAVGNFSGVDARGRFSITGVPAGSYELSVQVNLFPIIPLRVRPFRQTITVGQGTQPPLTITLQRVPETKEGQ